MGFREATVRLARRPAVAAAALGALVVAVVAVVVAAPAPEPAPAGPPVRWQDPVEVASGDARRGPWRMNRSEFHYVDDPTVAITERGVVVVAWVDQTRKDVLLQIYEPDGRERLDEPVSVSRTPEVFSWLPRVVLGSEDAEQIYVLWQEIVFSGGTHGGEAFFSRSTDGGRSFDGPTNLSHTTHGVGKGRLTDKRWHNGSLDLARGSDGTLYAAWTEYQGPLRVARSTDGGASFSSPLHVSGGSDAPARGPSLAVAPGGAVYLAWTEGGGPSGDIRFTRSTDAGRSFGDPQAVDDTPGHSDAPKIAVDGRGTLHLVWAESPDGLWERYHLRYARSDDGGESFSDPRRIARHGDGAVESVAFPHLSIDGADNLYVLCELYPRPDGRPHGLGIAVSTDRGDSFSSLSGVSESYRPELGFNGSQQGLLMRKLDVAGTGELAVVNSTFARGEASHVWLFRGEARGLRAQQTP